MNVRTIARKTTVSILLAAIFLGAAQFAIPDQASAKTKPKKTRKSRWGDPDLTGVKKREIVYKKASGIELKLHVFEPEKKPDKPAAAIVFFFGGGWVGGTPSQFFRQSAYLASRGMVAISAEYRTRGRGKATPYQCVEDGKSAIRYVRKHAKELGVDPGRIAAGGGSAGGHVATATGTTTAFEAPGEDLKISSRPNAMVLFNPVYDNSAKGYGHSRVKDRWKEISPMHNITKDTPPAIVFLGDSDKLIPVKTALDFQARMVKCGARSELHVYKNKPHGFFNSDDYMRATMFLADKFLSSLGYLQGKPTIDVKGLNTPEVDLKTAGK